MKKIVLSVIILLSVLAAKGQCPAVHTVYISGPYCGGALPHLMLSNSESGTSYQLYNGSAAYGSPVAGSTGSILDFGAIPLVYYPSTYASSYFTVVATNTTSSCTRTMHDSIDMIRGVPAFIGHSAGTCVGDTLWLRDSVAHGVWSTSDTSIAIIASMRFDSSIAGVYGVSAGTVTITYTLTSVCGSSFETIPISVFAAVTPPTVSGPSTVCIGIPETYTSSSTSGGGMWSVGSSGIATINAVTGDLMGISAGTTTVTYTQFGACRSTFGTMPITVNSSSALIAAPFAIEVGATATATTSMSSPTWGVTPASVASISTSGIVTGLSLGYSRIYCSSGSSCASRTLPVIPTGSEVADSFYVSLTHDCIGPFFSVITNSPSASLHLMTYFGDGSTDYRTVGSASFYPMDTFRHAYSASGDYTIKHVLYYGSVRKDSISYTYHHVICHDISLSLFYDVDSNCNYNSGTDFLNLSHVNVCIDSNGVAVDTVSVTSGFYYRASGTVGDVYRFRVLSPYLVISCPSSGIITDTLSSGSYTSANIAVPLTTTSTAGFDLSANVARRTGRHTLMGEAVVSNPYGTATGATVTIHFDPRYSFYSASPTPASVSGSTVTWSLSAISAAAAPSHINYHLETSGSWLTPGDTARTTIVITPTSGDIDSTNNNDIFIDTIKSSFDPNFVAVSPGGNIFNSTKLHYTIHFENDGNDTAENIYVLDTLSDNVDPATLQIEMATAAMNVSYIHFGTHTVVKFDFPHIKLLDSTHHDQCTGFVQFNVRTRPGLTDGTTIPDRAGIYFDDNEVVMTNSVVNTIVIPAISIATASTSACIGDTVHFTATAHSVANTHYQWYIGSTPVGTDTSYFSSSTLSTGAVVVCKMTSVQDATIVLFSNYIAMSVFPHLAAGIITGPSSVCAGAAITLADSVTGGSWAVSNSNASIASGVVTGVTGGLDTVTYSVSNYCGTATASYVVTINNTTVVSDSIAVTRDTVCAGDTVIFTVYPTNGGSSPFYQWQKFGVNVDTGVTFTYVPTLSDVITCNMSSSVICPLPAVATSNSITMLVIPSVTPTVSIIASPVDTITYYGQLVTFYATVTYGGTATTYQWYNHGVAITGATSSSYNTSVYSNDTVYCVITSNVPCATSSVATSNTIVIYADYLGVHDFKTIAGTFSIFPNPNTGSFTLTGSGLGNEALDFEVRDVAAKVVYSGVINPVNGMINQTVDINKALPSGNYFIRLISAGGAAVLPFVKE